MNESDLIADIAKSVKTAGGCIFRGMYEQRVSDAWESEIRPSLESVKRVDQKRDDLVPSRTRMVTGVLSKSRTYAFSVAGNGL